MVYNRRCSSVWCSPSFVYFAKALITSLDFVLTSSVLILFMVFYKVPGWFLPNGSCWVGWIIDSFSCNFPYFCLFLWDCVVLLLIVLFIWYNVQTYGVCQLFSFFLIASYTSSDFRYIPANRYILFIGVDLRHLIMILQVMFSMMKTCLPHFI